MLLSGHVLGPSSEPGSLNLQQKGRLKAILQSAMAFEVLDWISVQALRSTSHALFAADSGAKNFTYNIDSCV